MWACHQKDVQEREIPSVFARICVIWDTLDTAYNR